jgi:hypothetical protein
MRDRVDKSMGIVTLIGGFFSVKSNLVWFILRSKARDN